MNIAAITVELPEPILHDAAELASKSGVSVASWIRLTVEGTLRDAKLLAEFERRRALGKDAETVRAILDRAPCGPPVPGDELDGGPTTATAECSER
jgi:hypothetical protein